MGIWANSPDWLSMICPGDPNSRMKGSEEVCPSLGTPLRSVEGVLSTILPGVVLGVDSGFQREIAQDLHPQKPDQRHRGGVSCAQGSFPLFFCSVPTSDGSRFVGGIGC